MKSVPRCYIRKRHGNEYSVGEPDLTACIDGRRIEIEVKRPGGYTHPARKKLQEYEIRKWREAGAIAFFATSLAEVQETLVDHGFDLDEKKFLTGEKKGENISP